MLLVFILAATALTASAQEDPKFSAHLPGWYLSEGGPQEFYIAASGSVRATTVVSWSCNFPAIGFQNSGSVTFHRGDGVQRFNVYFPWDGWYRDPHEGTISISYTRNGSVETETTYPIASYAFPFLTVDDLRVVEGDEEQAASLRFSRPSHVPWLLNISAGDETAHEASDFSLTDREVTFAAGATTSQVRFRAPKDGVPEGEETFILKAESVRKFDFYDTPYLAGTGTITIDDSEITAHADPSTITIFSGDPFDVSVTLNRPLSSSETVTASIETSDIQVVKPQLAAVPLHPGSTSFSVPLETDHEGDAIITVSFPEALGVAPVNVPVRVFSGEVTFDRVSVTLRKTEQASVGMRMTPAPPQPVVAPIQLSGLGVLRLDDAPPIGTDGASIVTFTAVAAGQAEIYAMNRSGNPALLTVNVLEAVAAKSLAPAAGPTAGGTPVTITGTGFAGACQVAFDDIASPSVTVLNDTTIRAIAPAHPAGIADVTVTCDGHAGTLPGSFTFTSASRRRSVR